MASAIPTKAASALNKDPPEVVIDKKAKKQYIRGKFLGKGGFAKCYELKDKENNVIYAGKVVSKAALVRSHQKEKMAQEIQIHKSLDHKHVVGFHSYFEDDRNVYIILELCSRRSLMEMHRRRRTLTEAEARYFLHQILLGCRYLVQQRVIHRDLNFDTLKNHIPKCPRYLVQCHQCETTKIPREDLEHHLKDFCPAAAVGCVFKDLGCKFKGSQFALDQHLEESSKSHLGLLCGIVSRQQQQISALRTALHGLVANTTGTLLWKISDYSHKMAEAKAQEGGLEICSPPFSTSAYGYRLMATLFLNGNGSGESTHLSVYIKLLPGDYDSLLPWPFAHTVSFALLDQPSAPEKACHIVESFVPDPTWKNFQRPSREPDALGFGFPRFVSHEMLKKCHYIRDNTLFIKVTVDESKIIAV